MSKSVSLLGEYIVTFPPHLSGAELVEYLIDRADEYAKEDGYEVCCIVPLKRKGDTARMLVYVQE